MCEWKDCLGHSNASGFQLSFLVSPSQVPTSSIRAALPKLQQGPAPASNESSRFQFSSEEAKGLIPEILKAAQTGI